MKTKIRNQKKIGLFCLVTAGILFGSAACRQKETTSQLPRLVKITEVKIFDEAASVSYPGKIDAASNVKLAFRVAGPIRRLYVSEGQEVRKGQLLAELDPRDYRIQLNATQAEYDQVTSESDRIVELYRRGSVSINDYDKAVSAGKRVSALLQAHRNALGDTKLKAPFDGYIQNKFFEAPEIVGQGTPVLSMIDKDYFEVKVDIPTGDFIRQEDFKSFYAVADVYPKTKIPLELLDITQGANYNQLFTVRFRMKRDDKQLLAPGMSVSVTIGFKPVAEDNVVVPVAALFQRRNGTFVWVYDDENKTVTAIPVSVIRLTKAGEALVRSELRSGQQVVSAGVHDLEEGQQVNPLPPTPASNVGNLLFIHLLIPGKMK